MVRLGHLFGRIAKKRVFVAGDFVMDHYVFGKSRRISPEAPVPVLLVDREEERAGGAGNVALNLISLGMDVSVLGCVGDDSTGSRVIELLEKEGIQVKGLLREQGLKTSKKTRVIASNQQIVRIDNEEAKSLSSSAEEKVLSMIPQLIYGHDLIAISDYAKGFLTDRILKTLIATAKSYSIPVIADPKGSDFSKYNHATILKPNLTEAYAAVHMSSKTHSLPEVAKAIFSKIAVDVLLVTRSEEGISLYYPDGSHEDYPVDAREIRDVVGAGDTVLAMLSAALANGLLLSEATAIANVAAMLAVERVGCARVTLSEVARRLIEMHSGSKIFTYEHFPALEQALKGQNFTLLQLQTGCGVNAQLLRALRELATDASRELVVSIADPKPDDELISVLASLRDVDYIHLNEEDSFQSSFMVQPSRVYTFSGQELGLL